MSFTGIATDGSINQHFYPSATRLEAGGSRLSQVMIGGLDDFTAAAERDRCASEFKKHERKWKRDTRYTSSLSDKYLHASYARIISLGPRVVPFILASLQREPDDWFYALRAITGADPVRAAHAGIMPKMSEAWINWGRQNGYC